MTRTIEKRTGKGWERTYSSTDAEANYKSLSHDLAAHYIGKAPYVKSIKRHQNYDGTQTYTVTYNNGTRAIYTGAIY